MNTTKIIVPRNPALGTVQGRNLDIAVRLDARCRERNQLTKCVCAATIRISPPTYSLPAGVLDKSSGCSMTVQGNGKRRLVTIVPHVRKSSPGFPGSDLDQVL
jgi:hypothetical protein